MIKTNKWGYLKFSLQAYFPAFFFARRKPALATSEYFRCLLALPPYKVCSRTSFFLKTKRIYLSKPAQTNLFLTSTLRLNTLCAFLALPFFPEVFHSHCGYPHFRISQKRESCQDHCVLLASCLLLQCLYFIIIPHPYKTFIMFTPSWYAHCSPSCFS